MLSFVKNLSGPDANLPSPIKKSGGPSSTSSPKGTGSDSKGEANATEAVVKSVESVKTAARHAKLGQPNLIETPIDDDDEIMEETEDKDASKLKPSTSEKK